MATRVLITDPDWQFLRHAFQALPRSEFDVIVETDCRRALTFARHWQPAVLIAPSYFLEGWYGGDEQGPPEPEVCPCVLITAYGTDDPQTWEPWLSRGYEVLLKPTVHPTELQVAMEAALGRSPNTQQGSYASA